MECFINGKIADVSDFNDDPLVQSLVISLFSWRKSNDDDGVQVPFRQGWWGDTYSENDRIGSRLWLLQREKVTNDVLARAEEYAAEALQWLVEDAVIERFEVKAERDSMDQISLSVDLYKPNDVTVVQARFQDLWSVK